MINTIFSVTSVYTLNSTFFKFSNIYVLHPCEPYKHYEILNHCLTIDVAGSFLLESPCFFDTTSASCSSDHSSIPSERRNFNHGPQNILWRGTQNAVTIWYYNSQIVYMHDAAYPKAKSCLLTFFLLFENVSFFTFSGNINVVWKFTFVSFLTLTRLEKCT